MATDRLPGISGRVLQRAWFLVLGANQTPVAWVETMHGVAQFRNKWRRRDSIAFSRGVVPRPTRCRSSNYFRADGADQRLECRRGSR